MDPAQQEQLVDEIDQLCRQYREEIPGKRRAWPASIKQRVLQLRQLELSWIEISKRTKIPVQTLYQWQSERNKKSFKSLTVIPADRAAKERKQANSGISAITVVVGDRARIEGLDLVTTVEILKRLGI